MGKRRLTKRQREIMVEWECHTGFDFMLVGDTFGEALRWNYQWIEDHTIEALCIGNDEIVV